MKPLYLLLGILFLSMCPRIVAAQAPEQDCINAIPVCQPYYSQTNSYTGTGGYATELTTVNQAACLPARRTMYGM